MLGLKRGRSDERERERERESENAKASHIIYISRKNMHKKKFLPFREDPLFRNSKSIDSES